MLHVTDLLLQHMLCVLVGDLAGLPDEGGVHHVAACHLLVQLLQAEEEGAVTEPGHGGLRHPLEVHVARQDGQVGVGDVRGIGGGVTIGDQHVQKDLKSIKIIT